MAKQTTTGLPSDYGKPINLKGNRGFRKGFNAARRMDSRIDPDSIVTPDHQNTNDVGQAMRKTKPAPNPARLDTPDTE